MKIMINYDLIDKIRESKTGISLHRYTTIMGVSNGLVIPAMLLGGELRDVAITDTLDSIFLVFGYSLFINGINAFGSSFFRKDQAIEELTKLSIRLNDICIKTNLDLLQGSYQYDVQYGINFDSFPPKIEQKKYIMVPVKNDWGNNERSLVQEHFIGTSSYALYFGQPEKSKSYSYGRRRVLNNK